MTSHLAPFTAGEALLVYGITRTGTGPGVQERDGMRGRGVHAVSHDDLVALVEPIDVFQPLGRRHDLLAYQRVLDAIVAGPVLPLRFGSVLDDEQVVTEFLAGSARELADGLARLADKVQLLVRIRYDLDVILSEIIRSNENVRRLREQTRHLPQDVGQFGRMRLGEMVADDLDKLRAYDQMRILPELTRHTSDWARRADHAIDGSLELAVLVDGAQRTRFEESAERVARMLSGRAHVQVLGPMAPFDFFAEVS